MTVRIINADVLDEYEKKKMPAQALVAAAYAKGVHDAAHWVEERFEDSTVAEYIRSRIKDQGNA